MKSLFIIIYLSFQCFALEIAPTNFDLRSLAILVSQECNKNIIVSKDVKNMSADYFFTSDITSDVLFASFSKLIESKGLFLNQYDGFFVIEEKQYETSKKNNSNIELIMKVIEINNDKLDTSGFQSIVSSNFGTRFGNNITDLAHFNFESLFSIGFSGVLKELETQNYLKIVSEPKVLVANGKTTTMNVGDTVAIVTSTASDSLSATTSLRNTYQQKDVGLTIKVTPLILDDGSIALNASLVLEALKSNENNLLQTSKKSINSEFTISDGGSIVIGGLTSNQDVVDISKVPLLGDIPLLSYFFSFESKKSIKTSLTIFIQAKVLK